MEEQPMSLFTNLKQEVIDIIPAVIYFCITFNLIFFITGLALKPGEVRYFSYSTVTLGALIVGKVMLIVNHFSFINAFPTKPLIYNIIWKFIIYIICIVLAWIIEELFHLIFEYDNVLTACKRLQSDFLSPEFWATF